MKEKDIELYELSAEISAVSLTLTALSYQLDTKSEALNEKSLRESIFGITRHLDRISSDLNDIDSQYNLTERKAV